MEDRYVVRETDFGYGIWDSRRGAWWRDRLDMTWLDARRLAAHLNGAQE